MENWPEHIGSWALGALGLVRAWAASPELRGWLVAAALALLWLLWMLARWLARRWRLWRKARRQQRAYRAEGLAEHVLARHGYRHIGAHVEQRWVVRVGEARHEVVLVADHLVERRGRRFVAEVKTGRAAPSVRTASTRRQLLEYLCAFEVDGVLLVNMEDASVEEVLFERAPESP